MLLTAQEDQVLTVGGSKIYFSVAGNVHWKYFNVKRHGNYKNELFDYHIQRNKDIGHNPAYKIEVNLPDSLFNEQLKIKKGFYAVNVDSLISFKFMIHNFYTEVGEGGGNFGPYFNVPNQFKVDFKNLFLISSDRNILDKIIPANLKESTNSEVNSKISDLVSKYLATDEKALKRQILHHGTIADSLKKYQTEEQISSLYNLFYYKIDENCYSTVGINKGNDRHKFLAFVFPSEDKIIFRTNTYLIQTFMIEEEMYIYYASHGSHNGAVVFSVSKIEGNELKTVFSDGSFSM
jgi:hypothetical protein